MEASEKKYQPRKNTLTEEDMENLASIFESIVDKKNKNRVCDCMFEGISPDDLRETILFCKHFNSVKRGSIKVVWNTFLVLGATGIIGLLLVGFFEKVKSAIN